MKNILLTGGAGFIGSHTSLALLEKGYSVFVIDSFENSSPKMLKRVEEIYKKKHKKLSLNLKIFKGDLRDKFFLEEVFSTVSKYKKIDGVIHFAGLKSVAESINKPLLYWENNVVGTINLLDTMNSYGCRNFVFSSSATVYRERNNYPFKENSPIQPKTPYGKTKACVETLLEDLFNSHISKVKFASLRYFNPIGAHESGLIGENPVGGSNNIFPIISDTAMGFQKKLEIYGDDWPTKDGTAIRDYIHVMDLAEAHIKVLEHLFNIESACLYLNIGTGIGTTVLDLVKTFEKVNNVKVPYFFKKRRIGDTAYLVADNSLSASKLNIGPLRSLSEMCRDGWKWKKMNPFGI